MPILFVKFFSLDSGIQIATIRMGLSIICFKGSQLDFPNKHVLQSLKIAFIIANSADSDEMQITELPFYGVPGYKGFIPLSDGPRREKTCLQGFRQSETQNILLSYRD